MMNNSRRVWRILYGLIGFLGLGSIFYYFSFATLKSGTFGGINNTLLFFWYIFLPIISNLHSLFWLPLIFPSRKLIIPISFVMAILVIIMENNIVPVKYFLPQTLLLFLTYGFLFILATKIMLPLGEGMKEAMDSWFREYRSPKTFYDLIKSAQKNIIANIRVQLFKVWGTVFIIVIILTMTPIIVAYPSLLGVGLFEIKKTFPSEKAFQKAVLERFFLNPPINDMSIGSYERNVPLVFVPLCRLSLPGDSNFRWMDFSQVFEGVIKNSQKPFAIALINRYSPFYQSGEDLSRITKNGVEILSYSKTYFRLSYGWETGSDSFRPFFDSPFEKILHMKENFEKDKRRRWFLKDGILLCAEVNNPEEENDLMKIIKLVKTE